MSLPTSPRKRAAVPETLHTRGAHSLSPHPATVDLKPLPLPPLEQTLNEYSTALSAVLDAEQQAHASRVIEDFAQSQGPLLDATLRTRAASREQEGTNWLHDEWYEGYLTVREPLQLSTNVGFQLAPFPGEATGMQRVAEAIQRIAAVHLQAAGETLPEDVDARGNRITLNQWFVFNGGLRHPQPEMDEIVVCTQPAAHREIGVFVDGRLFALPISDEAGNVTSRDFLAANLHEILTTAARTEGTSGTDFNAASLTGSAQLAEELAALVERNPRTYQRLSDFLFTVDLLNTEDRSDAELLADLAFRPRGAWVYKPLSYQLGLDSDWTAVHVEHSCQDGGTLVTAVARMQTAEVQESSALGEHTAEELSWDVDDALARKLRDRADACAAQAAPYTATLHTVDIAQPADLPFKFSRDASAQLIMTIAQQLTYGRVRAVYEAVDMREYRAGRTECLRALTPEAATFARNLVAGSATREQLVAATEAHRAWVKRCKSGNGFDRHIQMLEHLEAQDPDAPGAAFFTDAVVNAARKDFLSTTSVGSAEQIVRYSFAPTMSEGFGINYTPLANATEYCVSYKADTAQDAQAFIAHLARASELLWQFCGELEG